MVKKGSPDRFLSRKTRATRISPGFYSLASDSVAQLKSRADMSDKSGSDDDVSDSSDGEPAPSETRAIRELGQGITNLVSSRPGPTRHDPPANPPPKIIKVNTLYNYNLLKSTPVQEIVSHKKQKRVELEEVQPEEIEVAVFPNFPSQVPYNSFF
jgi:hypothetical protein